MASFCNTLQKLPPPSFVTTVVKNEDKRVLIQKWSCVITKSRYKLLKGLIVTEVNHLTGYVERKGTQLRLEKALMLTKQIQKIVQRWKINEFHAQFLQLQRSVGDFDENSGYLRETKNKAKERLPSTQWVNWVIYLTLRDAALLAKISIECENTIQLWLGLISSAHHWGDSLVICGILSRIWLVASNMTEDLAHVIYPCLREASHLVTPNNTSSWPDESFKPPADLLLWIQTCLKLPFRTIQAKEFIEPSRWRPKKNFNKLAFLADFFSSELDKNQNSESEPAQLETEALEILPEKLVSDAEDFGMVVQRVLPLKKKLKQREKLPKIDGNDQNSIIKTIKGVRAHWKKFYINIGKKLKSVEGRRKLVNRIIKYRKHDTDTKLRAKLLKLKKLVLNSEDSDHAEAAMAFNNLQLFTTKYVNRLKKRKKVEEI
ncbi:unnamed protein product [Allacma fusca]|uniref:Nucleolus and neural progenitor protein-like N-terminal domain-containing protein n=1 Tax=Allacma fusca TaxID=39272 RepID=A0A8J2JZ52_9HEXA|nr:unnamed protein product [Allacma fusca]